jgi:D-alanyl-D-alanine carboxypeptidase/D-alanyl-D-alanine-endopeptidase (penicillin-binding protein 4)
MQKSMLLISSILAVTLVTGCIPEQKDATTQVLAADFQFVEKFTSAKPLANASIACKVMDVNTGEVLLSHNEAVTMIPASVLKLVTTATALEVLSPEQTFSTTLAYTGEVDEYGVLHGDLIIVGGGDPALASREFPTHYGDIMERFAGAVKAAGITRIEGRVVGDASLFGEIIIPDTWIWEDIGNYYGAAATALNIFDNSYNISFATGGVGSPARLLKTDPEIPGLSFDNRVVAASDNRDNAYVYGTYLSDKRMIRGTIPANREAFTIRGAIPDPALLAAQLLTQWLRKSGIDVSGEPSSTYTKINAPNGKTLLEIESPTLAELVSVTNLKSHNLLAETLLMHLSPPQNEASSELTSDFIQTFWNEKGMSTGGMFFADGSGLSRVNGITAGQMIFLLEYMYQKSKFAEEFRQSFPVAGVSGNLLNFGKETILENNLAAKSGSMARVLNYAGYFRTQSGREAAFVVMVNNYDCPPSQMRTLIADFLVEMAVYF